MQKPITFDSFVRTGAVIVGLVLVVMAVNYLSAVLIPFFVAWFVAYLIFPVVEFFQYKLKFRFRILAIIATLLLIGGVLFGIGMLTIPEMIEDISKFGKIARKFVESINDSNMQKFLNEYLGYIDAEKLLRNGQFIDIAKTVVPGVFNILEHTAGVIISIVSWSISVLYLFFILYDYDKIARSWHRLVPRKYHRFARGLVSDLKNGMNAYFRGQMLIAFCVGVLFCIGFSIIDFPLAIPLGILIGMMNFVPYLQTLGMVPAVLLCFIKADESGSSFWGVLIAMLAVFVVVQMIQDFFLTPKIMGNAIGLPPFVILLSLSVWGYLMGIIGMIIALPLTTIIFSYYKRYVSKPDE